MNFLKKVIILFWFFTVAINCKAHAQYPKAILPGQKSEISAGTDTLWILNNKQFDNALIHAKELKMCDSLTAVQKQIIKNREEVISTQEEKITILDTSYNHYKALWNSCDSSLQKTEIQVVKVKKSRKIVGIVSAVAGALIVIVLNAVL